MSRLVSCTAVVVALLAIGYMAVLRPRASLQTLFNTVNTVVGAEYDYIVVGSGSAGSVVAARLSEDKDVQVLLLEAGGTGHDFNVLMPAGSALVQRSANDWQYYTTPQKQASRKYRGQRSFWPRGKMLGGTSGMNYMHYVRGNKEDFNYWHEAGCTGWNWDNVLPFFKKYEGNVRADLDPYYHSTTGPQTVGPVYLHNITRTFVDAAVEAGFTRLDDLNGAEQLGVGIAQAFVKNGQRFTVAEAYLEPALSSRTNLAVAPHSHVTRVLFEGKRAVGVEYVRNGETRTVRARREVILSAGSISSPHLLMLSGVGPKAHLEAHGIKVVHDLPAVGQHLQDHLVMAVSLPTKQPVLSEAALTVSNLLIYVLFQQGPLSSNAAEASAFMRSPALPHAPHEKYPDLQFMFLPTGFSKVEEETMGAKFILHPSIEEGGVTIVPTLLHPKSRGSIQLNSSNPFDAPIIEPNYLSHQRDVDVLVEGVKTARRIFAQPSLRAALTDFDGQPWNGDMTAVLQRVAAMTTPPTAGAPPHPVDSDAQVAEFVRDFAATVYHPVGTCRCSAKNDGSSVVDPQLRVHGLQGLRVIDASIMPEITSGNTHAPTIMIGERGAHLIRNPIA